MEFDEDIDARGLICPLPVLRARKRLLAMAPGRVLRLRATDPAAVVDVPHFCREAGHQFLTDTPDGAGMAYFIRRGDGPAGEG
ncbi:tRNA 2-thiouridine synthesizing protein A [Defluviimonas denitrificans]|jgi:tRNA 2-thiouridine synthesizing protein A|uniref:tRNA 2-thiouridine synthesizing protein A n=1 Tax=Albidovulum denitrificans TaxID=404881 RepID=A0A2S8S899_9RHOB|nr:sulfurtransferase TusA family protein [Defluviimonas denitrificans]PQV56989.1 tRNA 2-thiouridine synthesizing protein A [Defluviimonas denitrificans]